MRVDLLRRAWAELAWAWFYLPRGGIQAAARRLPLDALRRRLPRAVSERIRLGLYPARITDPAAPTICAREHPNWGEPARLDAEQPVVLAHPPRASVIIVTYGNLLLTRLCLASLQRAATDLPFELIVVDNGSSDGTVAWLRQVADSRLLPLRVVENRANLGFAAANNQGARLARGDILVLLNNDTVVVPGWLDRMVRALDNDPTFGLVGPVTNSCGNEAAIPTTYRDLEEMTRFAEDRALSTRGRRRELPMLTLFCAALPRRVWDQAGGLDERYRVGLFEDDDLAMAVRRLGLKVVLLEDTFVHHWGGAAFSSLPARRYLRLWWENRRRFERKWGVRWVER